MKLIFHLLQIILILLKYYKKIFQYWIEKERKICIEYPFYEKDISKLIDCQNFQLTRDDIKIILFDTISAISYLHQKKIMHRDIKPPNLLINTNGEIVLADFDLARNIPQQYDNMTKNLVTRWYRPPEILFGSKNYTESVDIWSFGCIMAELIMERPIFPGDSEIDQLVKIFEIRGTPNDQNWPDRKKLQNYFDFEDMKEQSLKKVIPKANPQEIIQKKDYQQKI